MSTEEKHKKLAEEFGKISKDVFETKVIYRLNVHTLLAVVAHIQVALRHPNNNGASSVVARRFALDVCDHLEQIDPTIAKVAEAGFDPNYGLAEEQESFPDGKVSDDDQGEMAFGIRLDEAKQLVTMEFNKPVEWMGFTLETLESFIIEMQQQRNELKELLNAKTLHQKS